MILCQRKGCTAKATRKHPVFGLDICGRHPNKSLDDFTWQGQLADNRIGSVISPGGPLKWRWRHMMQGSNGHLTIVNPVKWCPCGVAIRPAYELCYDCLHKLAPIDQAKVGYELRGRMAAGRHKRGIYGFERERQR